MVSANFVTDLTEIATQITEAVGSIASGIQSYRLLSISSKYQTLYKNQKDFYNTTFKLGVEGPLVAQINSTPQYALNYVGRLNTIASTANGPFGGRAIDIEGIWARRAAMYGSVKDPRILGVVEDTALIQSDWANFLHRYEEKVFDAENDFRWQNRLLIHNLGIRQASNISSALDSSLGQYQGQLQDFSNMLATYGNGFAKYAGYRRGLNDAAEYFNTGTRLLENNIPSYSTDSHIIAGKTE